MKKAIITDERFFKTWDYGKSRIRKEKDVSTHYPYMVEFQINLNGTWDLIGRYHTLAEAKKAREYRV